MAPRSTGYFGAYYVKVFFLFAVSLFLVLNTFSFFSFHFRSWFLIPLSFSISYLLTPLACALAARLGIMDIPNERKVHAEATPLLGGLPVFLAFSLSTISILWYSSELKGVIYAATLIFVTGLLDDRYNLSSLVRLFAQFAAVCILFLYGMEIDFVPDFTQWHIIKKLATIIWVIGITNAVNFLDGLDGLCAGYGAISAFFMGCIAFLTHQYFLMFLALSLAGSCLGFLPWNFRRGKPARIFMGDAGSLFIGFTLASLSLMGSWAENRTVALAVPILILFLPIFDVSMTTFIRIRKGRVRSFRQWLDYAGKDHIHHRVYATGIGARNAVFVLYSIAVMLGFSAIIIRTGGPLEAYLALTQAGVVLVFFVAFLVYVKRRDDAITRISERMADRSIRNDKMAEAGSA